MYTYLIICLLDLTARSTAVEKCTEVMPWLICTFLLHPFLHPHFSLRSSQPALVTTSNICSPLSSHLPMSLCFSPQLLVDGSSGVETITCSWQWPVWYMYICSPLCVLTIVLLVLGEVYRLFDLSGWTAECSLHTGHKRPGRHRSRKQSLPYQETDKRLV